MKKDLVLKEILSVVYSIYPTDIDYLGKQLDYVNSKEYEKLRNLLGTNEKRTFEQESANLLKKMEASYGTSSIIDNTVFSWLDRCLNWQVSLTPKKRHSKNYVLCLNLSIVSEYYIIYILETNYDKMEGRLKCLPKRNKEVEENLFSNEISSLSSLVENSTSKTRLSDDFLEFIIPDISFQDIEFGKFTLFNALFLNEFNTKVW